MGLLTHLRPAFVIEQLARMRVLGLGSSAAAFTDRLHPMLEALAEHITPVRPGDHRPAGMMLDGCFNKPREFAQNHELIWTTAYLLMALYYLETGRVLCQVRELRLIRDPHPT